MAEVPVYLGDADDNIGRGHQALDRLNNLPAPVNYIPVFGYSLAGRTASGQVRSMRGLVTPFRFRPGQGQAGSARRTGVGRIQRTGVGFEKLQRLGHEARLDAINQVRARIRRVSTRRTQSPRQVQRIVGRRAAQIRTKGVPAGFGPREFAALPKRSQQRLSEAVPLLKEAFPEITSPRQRLLRAGELLKTKRLVPQRSKLEQDIMVDATGDPNG